MDNEKQVRLRQTLQEFLHPIMEKLSQLEREIHEIKKNQEQAKKP